MTLYYGFDKTEVIHAVKYDLSQEGGLLRYSAVAGEYAQTNEGTIFRVQLTNGNITDIEVDAMTKEEVAKFNKEAVQHAIITKGKSDVMVLSSDNEVELDQMILHVYKKHYKLTSKEKVGALLTKYENYKKHVQWFAQSAGQ